MSDKDIKLIKKAEKADEELSTGKSGQNLKTYRERYKSNFISVDYSKSVVGGIVVRDPKTLTEHPRNDEHFPEELIDPEEDQALLEDIKSKGIHDPLIINEDNVVLCGHRRLRFAKQLKIKTVQCRVYTRISDKPEVYEPDEEDFMVKDNLFRRQLSKKTRMRLYKTFTTKELGNIIRKMFTDEDITRDNRGQYNQYSNNNKKPTPITKQLQEITGLSKTQVGRGVAEAKKQIKTAKIQNKKISKSVQLKIDKIDNDIYELRTQIQENQSKLNKEIENLRKMYKPKFDKLKKKVDKLETDKEKLLE